LCQHMLKSIVAHCLDRTHSLRLCWRSHQALCWSCAASNNRVPGTGLFILQVDVHLCRIKCKYQCSTVDQTTFAAYVCGHCCCTCITPGFIQEPQA
jgi:hypothetical protein